MIIHCIGEGKYSQIPANVRHLADHNLATPSRAVPWYQIRIWAAGQGPHHLPGLAPHNENVNVRIGDYLSIFSLD